MICFINLTRNVQRIQETLCQQAQAKAFKAWSDRGGTYPDGCHLYQVNIKMPIK